MYTIADNLLLLFDTAISIINKDRKRLVERDRGAEQGVDDVRVVVELLVDHEAKDAHLGGATIVQLDGKLLVDSSLVPSRSLELGSLDFVLAGSEAELEQADEGDDLGDSSSGDGLKGGKTSLDGGERNTIGNLTRKADASSSHDVAKDSKLCDAAVLGLYSAKALETSGISIRQKTKRVPETKRSLGTDFILISHLQGTRTSHTGRRSESSDAKDSSKETDGAEHGQCV